MLTTLLGLDLNDSKGFQLSEFFGQIHQDITRNDQVLRPKLARNEPHNEQIL